ncbi:MAG: L-serine ammonia-lyase [Alphaproteobacteria bacterium]
MIGTFDLFKIGIGPSSSHTVGPMRAARLFVESLADARFLFQVTRVETTLFGSLAYTGKGHATDRGIVLGLAGFDPATVDPESIASALSGVRDSGWLNLGGRQPIRFDACRDIRFDFHAQPSHPNALSIVAFDGDGRALLRETYHSLGGGFVAVAGAKAARESQCKVPYPFADAAELLALCAGDRRSIAELMWANETARCGEAAVAERLRAIVDAMDACIERGCRTEGVLPGGLNVRRRAPGLRRALENDARRNARALPDVFEWVSLFAIAVNEENAAGSRVVTAPTNGAAGLLPAVLTYYRRFCPDADERGTFDFLLTAAAIGGLYKRNASISGAEVGCQGEVGVACSMAAAGLAAALDGTPTQVENAAEIGMEHHLGMTCDPVGGLVQIPCIERNAMGAIKAINAASLALRGDGSHRVSLDAVIATMRQTGADMSSKYKETSQGGLAATVAPC